MVLSNHPEINLGKLMGKGYESLTVDDEKQLCLTGLANKKVAMLVELVDARDCPPLCAN